MAELTAQRDTDDQQPALAAEHTEITRETPPPRGIQSLDKRNVTGAVNAPRR
jgi:hypothetical protein